MARVDVLIPTRNRPAALAVTLAGLAAQTVRDFRLVVSDQSDGDASFECPEGRALLRVLDAHGHEVELHRHLPRRGMAEQRDFLLGRARSPLGLFLDDDVFVEPDVLERLRRTMERERCGFVGCGLVGLSFAGEVRPEEHQIEWWDGPVRPETVLPGGREWARYRLHNGANLLHVQRSLARELEGGRTYRVAWVGGCALYDVEKLRSVGGFSFWRDLPAEHAGEDVLVQLRLLARFGGCGLLPTGAYHQELPTTIDDRRVDAPRALA